MNAFGNDAWRGHAHLRLAAEVTGLGVWTWHIGDDEVLADERAREIFGIHASQPLSLAQVMERIHPDDHARVTQALQAAADPAGDGRYAESQRILRSDGSLGCALVRGQMQFEVAEDGSRRPVELFGSIIDVTEQVNVQDRYRSLFDAIDQGFCVIEVLFDDAGAPVDYRFLETNARFVAQTGLVDVLGRCMRELAPGHEEHWFRMYGQVAKTGVPIRFEDRAEALGRWYDVYAFRVGDPLANQVAVLFADITARKLAETARREAEQRKDEFLATLAHELRNPLAPLRTSLYVLRGTDNPAMAQHLHEVMERQVEHLVRLVDDLMEASRITRGHIRLQCAVIDLGTVLQDAVASIRAQVDENAQTLEIQLPEGPLWMEGDAVRLTQVVSNLLNNASRYSRRGGRIRLRAWRDDATVSLAVGDDGIGIPPNDLRRIFEPFTQLDRHASRAQQGLGIGLSLVRSLVQLHGGEVTAASDGPGRGSEFTVRLPVCAGAGRDVAVDERTPDGDVELAGLRVLVADDNCDAADSVGEWLAMHGAKVRVAYGGAAALAAIQDEAPDVVLLDLGMPGMDGFELARRVRSDARLATMRLVALTGWGHQLDRARTRSYGFDHHLTKPPDLPSLRALMASIRIAARA